MVVWHIPEVLLLMSIIVIYSAITWSFESVNEGIGEERKNTHQNQGCILLTPIHLG